MNTVENNGKANNNIEAVSKGWKHGDFFIVGVKDGKKIPEILVNRDEEDVIALGYNVIHKSSSHAKAEMAVNHFICSNTCFCVIEFIQDGEKKYKILRYEGIVTTAPAGTVGICRRRDEAVYLKTRLEERVAVAISATA